MPISKSNPVRTSALAAWVVRTVASDYFTLPENYREGARELATGVLKQSDDQWRELQALRLRVERMKDAFLYLLENHHELTCKYEHVGSTCSLEEILDEKSCHFCWLQHNAMTVDE